MPVAAPARGASVVGEDLLDAPAAQPGRLTPHGLREYLRRSRIPASHLDVSRLAERINLAAEHNGLDPGLLLAVIRVESTFRPDAISERGAVGLMQLLPQTAAELAHELGRPWEGGHALLDPDLNIDLGARYLRKLLDRFDGQRDAALQAYYQGPTRLEAEGASASFAYARIVGPQVPPLR